MYQALYRKWRPRSFDDVVGQEHITTTLKRQVSSGRLSHAYLFTGTRGTGKTTCAKLLARAVNCEHPVDGNPCNQCPSCVGIENGSILDVLELDAASNSRVDDIRGILDEAAYTPASVKKRVYIIDEVHAISPQAFNVLLKILEEPPEHLMFILATTEIHKVPATIKSRCQQFAFKRIHANVIAQRLCYVAEQEQLPLEKKGAALIARLADGGMRDALSLLDQCIGDYTSIGELEILTALGLAGNRDTAQLMNAIVSGDAASVLTQLDRLYGAGKEMSALVGELASLTRDLLIQKTAPVSGVALMTGGFDSETLSTLSAHLSAPRLAQMLTALQNTAAELVRSANRRTDMELCLLSLCNPALDPSPTALTARMDELERRLEEGIPVRTVSPPVQTKEPPPTLEAPVPQQNPSFCYTDEDAPPPRDNRPPWEDSPPWEEPKEDLPPKKQRKPAPPKTAAPASKSPSTRKSSPPVIQSEQGVSRKTAPGDWSSLCARLEKTLTVADYCFIGNAAMVVGEVQGDMITLWADTDMIKTLINKPDIISTVSETAQNLWGRPMQTQVKVGKPASPPPAAQRDALEEFLAEAPNMGNITVTD